MTSPTCMDEREYVINYIHWLNECTSGRRAQLKVEGNNPVQIGGHHLLHLIAPIVVSYSVDSPPLFLTRDSRDRRGPRGTYTHSLMRLRARPKWKISRRGGQYSAEKEIEWGHKFRLFLPSTIHTWLGKVSEPFSPKIWPVGLGCS